MCVRARTVKAVKAVKTVKASPPDTHKKRQWRHASTAVCTCMYACRPQLPLPVWCMYACRLPAT